jgi:hypothetical protein
MAPTRRLEFVSDEVNVDRIVIQITEITVSLAIDPLVENSIGFLRSARTLLCRRFWSAVKWVETRTETSHCRNYRSAVS